MSALVALCALAAAFVAGCSSETGAGDDCTSLCDESNNCPGAAMTDCTHSCATADAQNMASGCTPQYNDVLSCAADQPDVCTTPATACSSQLAAYESCIVAFCMQSPRPPSCNAGG